jgi:hypothetical protein
MSNAYNIGDPYCITDLLAAPESMNDIPLTREEWEYFASTIEDWRRGTAASGNAQEAWRLGEAWRLIVNYIDHKEKP